MMDQLAWERQASMMTSNWETDPRWVGIERPYTANDVVRLRGSVWWSTRLPGSGLRDCGICCIPNRMSPRWAR